MRFQISQKLISVGDDFSIRDEHGVERFFVDGYGFCFGNKLSFQDMRKQELLLIKQTLFSFRPHYKLFQNGRIAATVTKSMFAFRDKFTLEIMPHRKRIVITGKLLEHEYIFTEGKQSIATVSKKWFTASDSYAVDIDGSDQYPIILAAAIVVDLVCHDKASKHKRRGRSTD